MNQSNVTIFQLPTPRQIVAHLDLFVRGQENAKRALASAVYYHYLGFAKLKQTDKKATQGLPFGSQSILLIGSSGCGKSYLVKLLSQYLDIPHITISAASLVPTGCPHGFTINDVIESLYLSCNKNVERTQQSIVFIDEIDKIRLWGEPKHDAFIQGIQDALLTTLDGSPISISSGGQRFLPMSPRIDIETTGILFICGGAFAGLTDIIQSRLSSETKKKIGFETTYTNAQSLTLSKANLLNSIITEDLVEFGLIREFIGRFNSISTLNPLDTEDLIQILVSAQDSILFKKRQLFAFYGIELIVIEPALEAIARKALSLNIGVRGLNRVVQDCLRDTEYQLPELSESGVCQVLVDEKTVENGLSQLFYASEKDCLR